MSTNKPPIQSTLEKETYAKLQELQKRLKRKRQSDMVRYIIEDWIEKYEAEHGPIDLPEDD